jgi:DNA/RNA non-specific endonuclease
LPKDHGGHFIRRQFGGPEIPYNHFAQNARFNNSDYRKLENEWKAHLKTGKKVKVEIRAYYDAVSKRPNRLNVTYYVNGQRFLSLLTIRKRGVEMSDVMTGEMLNAIGQHAANILGKTPDDVFVYILAGDQWMKAAIFDNLEDKVVYHDPNDDMITEVLRLWEAAEIHKNGKCCITT